MFVDFYKFPVSAQQGNDSLSENQAIIEDGWIRANAIFGSYTEEDYDKFLEQISLLKLTEDDKQYFYDSLLIIARKHLSQRLLGQLLKFERWVKTFEFLDDHNLLDNSTKEELVKLLYHNAKYRMDKKDECTSYALDSILILLRKTQNYKFCSTIEKQNLITYFLKRWVEWTIDYGNNICNTISSLAKCPQELMTGEIKEILKKLIEEKAIYYIKLIFREARSGSLQLLSDLISVIKKSSWGSGTTKLITDRVTQFLNEETTSTPDWVLSNISELFDNFSGTIEEELYDAIMLPLVKHLNELSKGKYASFHNACEEISRNFSDKIVRYCEEKNYRRLANSLTIMMDHIEIDE